MNSAANFHKMTFLFSVGSLLFFISAPIIPTIYPESDDDLNDNAKNMIYLYAQITTKLDTFQKK